MPKRSLALLGLIVALLAALPALPAAAGEPPPTTKHYPSDCGTVTLQLCINSLSSGSTVFIDTDAPIEEFVTINKNFVLGAAPGSHPQIDGGIAVNGPAANITVTVQDLTVVGGVHATLTGGSFPHVIVFDRLHVTGGVNTTAISVFTTVAASVTIRSSTALDASDTVPNIEVDAFHDAGEVDALLVGNRTSADDPTSGAGIAVRTEGDGVTHAAIYNNVVWKGAGWDGSGSAGIHLATDGAGDVAFDVVGNTVDRVADDGLRLDDTLTSPGHVSLDLFDNVFAKTDDSGVEIASEDPATVTVRSGWNVIFGAGAPSVWGGAATGIVIVPARIGFVDEPNGDLRLKATSTLVDGGTTCTAGGLENLDAAGHARLAGPTLDLGAYERGAGAPTGVALVGTDGGEELVGGAGADIICGLGGGDALFGGGGRDFIDGGAGPDAVLNGQAGPDRVFGGKGDDVCLDGIDGVEGNDRLDGGKGADGARGDPSDVLIRNEGPPLSCSD
jgi:hypothetical protein